MADDLKKQIGSGIVALVAVGDGKASLVVGVTDDLTERFDAVALVRKAPPRSAARAAAEGRTWPRAGGPDATAAEKALESIERALSVGAG